MLDTVVHDNTAASGGGAYIACAIFRFLRVRFSRNQALESGGGLVIDDCPADAIGQRLCSECEFRHNRAAENGGGLLLRSASLSGAVQTRPRGTGGSRKHEGARAIDQRPSAEDEMLQPYAFINATFYSNTAAGSGGGISFSVLEYSALTFGPTVNISHNEASEFGGGLFFGSRLVNSTWFYGASFVGNVANYGGGSVAWGLNTDLESQSFCDGCIYAGNAAPYQLENGFATVPMGVEWLQQPPTSIFVSNETFQVEVSLIDGFGTVVTGTLLVNNSYPVVASISAPCALILDHQQVPTIAVPFSPDGVATFAAIEIAGREDDLCELSMQALVLGSTISPVVSELELHGCPKGSEIVVGSEFDTCGPFTGFWHSEGPGVLVVSACLVVLAGVGSLLFVILALIRRRAFSRRAYVEIGESALTVTLQGILIHSSHMHMCAHTLCSDKTRRHLE